MLDKTNISTFIPPKTPMIYAFTLPGVAYREGWIKIGESGGSIRKRILGQTSTAGIRTKLEWQDYAYFRDGSQKIFHDTDFHKWLTDVKKVKRLDEEDMGRELFRLGPEESKKLFAEFASGQLVFNPVPQTFTLRGEQAEAVAKTRAWFERPSEGQDFLWNAKPRFGKTLTSYALIEAMGFKKVLVLSNRPSISNSWAEDFYKFLSGKKEYSFVSDNDALKPKPTDTKEQNYKTCVLTRQKFLNSPDAPKKMIAFESLQGLKGSIYFGGGVDKLKWINDLEFDLLIVDESHEGVATFKTEQAFENIQRKHTLYLSGTPFKQLAGGQFGPEQIFNWSYADEQAAKEDWRGPDPNPYAPLPRLSLFTYQMSEIIRDKAKKGIVLAEGEGAVDYAFDLNEFFLTNASGRFVHEAEVRKFIKALRTQEKYPFSTPELREELAHTMWHLNRVASARALAKLLKEDEVFKDYEIVLAVGEGEPGTDKKAFDRVKKAIAEHGKTITLTVGQLTVGVTIPQWSAVLMLCNMESPAAYMQAAFRAQNPCFALRNGELVQKENAYVFDFDPARTLKIVGDFAVNLSPETTAGAGTEEDREEKIMRLLNFLPVIGEDEQGKMVELDAAQVLAIPARLKSREVVRAGFMSNFLFANIGNIFAAPAVVTQILKKLPTASEEKRKPDPDRLDEIDEIPVDENGEVAVAEDIAIGLAQGMFGKKIYAIIDDLSQKAGESGQAAIPTRIGQTGHDLKKRFKTEIIAPAGEGLSKAEVAKIEKKAEAEIDRQVAKITAAYERDEKVAKAALEKARAEAASGAEQAEAEARYAEAMEEAGARAKESLEETIRKTFEEKPAEIVREVEASKASHAKQDVESEIRAHLRGFARTIPSFIMAYGDKNLTLANFEKYVTPEVFREVTGITLENFLFLRDGGEYLDEKTGKLEKFKGNLFDEAVFNDSIVEFLRKKEELKNYFAEDQDEDIFDYIPPQKTNQIYTPRQVVAMMVEQLEAENPGCFDDPNKTFADLYMKSGLYITEIVKRLYRSGKMKEAIPEDGERLRHIFAKQVFGLAPSEIIYRIALNYILGFADDAQALPHNFRQADALAAAKSGRLEELVQSEFGG